MGEEDGQNGVGVAYVQSTPEPMRQKAADESTHVATLGAESDGIAGDTVAEEVPHMQSTGPAEEGAPVLGK